jgi:hypothetical protein
VDVAALVVSLFALAVAGLSAWYSRSQARAATSEDRRARRPVLDVTLRESVSSGELDAMFYVENQGTEDLDSVVVLRPETADRVRYPVACLGHDFEDEAELGPLEIKAKQAFVLRIGSAEDLPEFRVRIKTRIGKETWEDAFVLDDPRFHVNVF